MVSTAKREGGQLRDKLQQGVAGLDLGDIEEYELFRSSPGMIRRRIPEQSRPLRSAASAAEPTAQPSASVKPAPSTTPTASTPELAAKSKPKPRKAKKDKPPESLRPSASIPPPAKASAADRETYDQMVKDFKSSHDESVRQRVTQRLESDRQSDNSLIRYYAVRAMTKLDPELFSTSLQSATQDEDATVRAIAAKALSRA